MKFEIYHLEFLTPCFCAGADQTRAELRPSAVRGQLRWWFRALGGTSDEERVIFGGVHDEIPAASTLIVRCRYHGGGQNDWFSNEKIPQQGMGNRAYLLGFFCGRTKRLGPGAALAPGSSGRVMTTWRKPPSPKLQLAMRAFFSLGALGFRSSRAAGAFASREHALTGASLTSLASELKQCGFEVALWPDEFRDWVHLCDVAGDILKRRFRSRDGLGISAGRNGTNPNALGAADPRQASVVQFRPARVDGKLRLVLIESPHRRTLGQKALHAHGDRGSILKAARLC